MNGGISHLVPSFQWPLPPLEEVSLTDSRSGHVMRALSTGVHLRLQVVNHFPVFDKLRREKKSGLKKDKRTAPSVPSPLTSSHINF